MGSPEGLRYRDFETDDGFSFAAVIRNYAEIGGARGRRPESWTNRFREVSPAAMEEAGRRATRQTRTEISASSGRGDIDSAVPASVRRSVAVDPAVDSD